jgi:hypothetical protein
MIKMQILMNENKILNEKRYKLSALYKTLDDFLVGRLHLKKGEDGFYFGSGKKSDFGNFGRAMWILGKEKWFMDNVNTWLYFNSDDSDNPNDFVVEDFKEFCFQKYQLGA